MEGGGGHKNWWIFYRRFNYNFNSTMWLLPMCYSHASHPMKQTRLRICRKLKKYDFVKTLDTQVFTSNKIMCWESNRGSSWTRLRSHSIGSPYQWVVLPWYRDTMVHPRVAPSDNSIMIRLIVEINTRSARGASRARVRMYIHIYTIYIHIYMLIYIHTYACVCIHAFICTCTYAMTRTVHAAG